MSFPREWLMRWAHLGVAALALLTFASVRGEDAAPDPARLIEQLKHDEFDVRRNAAEKLVAMGESSRTALEKASGSDELEIREAATALLQRLDKYTLTILAFDRNGKPAVGAEAEAKVYAQTGGSVNWNEPRSETITISAQGEAQLPAQAPGHIGMQFTWKKWLPVREASAFWGIQLERGNNPFLFTLSKGGTIKTSVKDADGKPLKDATVFFHTNRRFDPDVFDLQLVASENWDRNVLSASSDAKGQVKLEGLADGAYQIVVKAPDFYSALGGTFRMHEGETVDVPDVSLKPRKNGKVTFVLKKPDGTPLKKTRISLSMDYNYGGPRAAELQRMARQLKSVNMQRQPETPETDDEGKVTLEEQRPGKYELNVWSIADTAWEETKVTVESGQTADAGVLKAVKTGILKGKVASSDAKGMQSCQVYAIPEDEAIDYEDGEPVMTWRFIYQQFNGKASSQTGADGAYEMKHLRPGKYALSIQARTGQFIIIYGIEMKAGETTMAPDAITPAPVFSGANQNVKGTVLLPNGKPAVGAQVGLVSGFSRWGRNCDDKGVFEFSVSDQLMPTQIVIKAADCKPYLLELTTPATQLKDLVARLEKQDYGDLIVRVVDESGKPLKGAILRPISGNAVQRNVYNQTTAERKAVTNKDGIARLTELAAGMRRLTVERDGYFCETEIKTHVVPDKESKLSVSMKAGLTLRGQVETPAGKTLEKCIVFMLDAKSRVTEVDNAGTFEFTGLAPGDYFVSAHAPGWVSQGRVKVSLKSTETERKAVTLKLDMASGAAVKLNEGARDFTASLMTKGSWNPMAAPELGSNLNALMSSIDGTGRAEFWGVAAGGEYDLVLQPIQTPYSGYRYNAGASKKASASLVAGGITARPIANVAEMKTLASTDVTLAAANAAVGGRLICEPSAGNSNTNFGSLSLKIIGSHAFGQLAFAYPNEFAQQDVRAPIILGTPPKGMRKATEHGNFSVRGLPPGDYKIYAEITPYNHAGSTFPKAAPMETKIVPTLIASFSIKSGEKLNLGTVKFQVPAKIIADVKSGSGLNEGEGEDRIQVFQP